MRRLRLPIVVAGFLILAGIAVAVSWGISTHKKYASAPTPYDVCAHVKQLIHTQAAKKMLARPDDGLSETIAINEINAFNVTKCTDTLIAVHNQSPVQYARDARCLYEASDATSAESCVPKDQDLGVKSPGK